MDPPTPQINQSRPTAQSHVIDYIDTFIVTLGIWFTLLLVGLILALSIVILGTIAGLKKIGSKLKPKG